MNTKDKCTVCSNGCCCDHPADFEKGETIGRISECCPEHGSGLSCQVFDVYFVGTGKEPKEKDNE